MSKDFESRFFDLLIDRLDKQDDMFTSQNKKLDEIHAQVKYTNGRVTKLEGETVPTLDKAVKRLEGKQGKKFSIEPETMRIFAFIGLGVVIIIATLLNIPYKEFLP